MGSEAEQDQINRILGRMDLAYKGGRFVWPWTRWRCKHADLRCIHGDEIIFGTAAALGHLAERIGGKP